MVRGRADSGRRRALLPLGHGPQREKWRPPEYGSFEFVTMDGEDEGMQESCTYCHIGRVMEHMG